MSLSEPIFENVRYSREGGKYGLSVVVLIFSLFIFVSSSLFSADPIHRLSTEEKVVALTFDDGPDPVFTPQILQILKEKQVQATFFLIGEKLSASPDLAKQIVSEGHTVGNHSVSHINYSWLSRTNMLKDIRDSQLDFKKSLGFFPILFRPPFGGYKEAQLSTLNRYYRYIVLWSADGLDWHEGETPEQVVQTIDAAIEPGAIFLFHDTNPVIVSALPQIIDAIQAKGFTCVSLGNFFNESQF